MLENSRQLLWNERREKENHSRIQVTLQHSPRPRSMRMLVTQQGKLNDMMHELKHAVHHLMVTSPAPPCSPCLLSLPRHHTWNLRTSRSSLNMSLPAFRISASCASLNRRSTSLLSATARVEASLAFAIASSRSFAGRPRGPTRP